MARGSEPLGDRTVFILSASVETCHTVQPDNANSTEEWQRYEVPWLLVVQSKDVKTMLQSKVKISQSKVKTSDLNAQSTLAAGGPSTDHCALTDKKSLIKMVTKW